MPIRVAQIASRSIGLLISGIAQSECSPISWCGLVIIGELGCCRCGLLCGEGCGAALVVGAVEDGYGVGVAARGGVGVDVAGSVGDGDDA